MNPMNLPRILNRYVQYGNPFVLLENAEEPPERSLGYLSIGTYTTSMMMWGVAGVSAVLGENITPYIAGASFLTVASYGITAYFNIRCNKDKI